MIKYLTVLFFIGFAFYSEGSSNALSRCYEKFRYGSVTYNFSENTKWKNPYSEEIFSFVHQQLSFLEGKILSHRQVKKYRSDLEALINHLETSSNSDIMARLNLMNPRLSGAVKVKPILIKVPALMNSSLSGAVKAFPEIVSFINSGKASQYNSLDTKTIIQLILSTFSRHTMTYLTHHHVEHLDWARISLILKQIADFKDKPSTFSLYKIQRAVEQKYSVKEYIKCK